MLGDGAGHDSRVLVGRSPARPKISEFAGLATLTEPSAFSVTFWFCRSVRGLFLGHVGRDIHRVASATPVRPRIRHQVGGSAEYRHAKLTTAERPR